MQHEPDVLDSRILAALVDPEDLEGLAPEHAAEVGRLALESIQRGDGIRADVEAARAALTEAGRLGLCAVFEGPDGATEEPVEQMLGSIEHAVPLIAAAAAGWIFALARGESEEDYWSAHPQALEATQRLALLQALARESSPEQTYRLPTRVLALNQVIGGKRHGKGVGSKIEVRPATLTVDAPKAARLEKGAQFEIPVQWKVAAEADDYDDEGVLTPEAVFRLVRGVMGPNISRMGHVAFALAYADAQARGEHPSGEFWFSPTKVAKLLGYKLEPNGKNKDGSVRTRISKSDTALVRRDFEAFASLRLTQIVRSPEMIETERMTLLYPTQRERITRVRGQRGRDQEVQMQIRKDLWGLVEREYVSIPFSLLSSGEYQPSDWAYALRLYEVLAGWARLKAKEIDSLPGGELVLSWEEIARRANLVGWSVRASAERARYGSYLRMLAARGAISFRTVEMADKREGVGFVLAAPRMAELQRISDRRRVRLSRNGGVDVHAKRRKWGGRRTRTPS